MKEILKQPRIEKGYSTRKLAELTKIDQALISKFENGLRVPTKKQIQNIAFVLEIELPNLLVAWYKTKLLNNLDFNQFAIQAISQILQEKGIEVVKEDKDNKIAEILDEIELLKQKLTGLK
jgi:transcriptional regulator with XRE-family HTH domain